jgi:hypothetical protein
MNYSGRLDDRKLVSNAITAPATADVNVLVWKSVTIFTERQQSIFWFKPNTTIYFVLCLF